MAQEKKEIYLIDGSGYMFRAYYAMMRQRLSNSKGVPTGATLAFARMLLNVIRDRAPEYVAVAFDRPEPTFRHDIYPAYKANRDAAPEDLVEQIPYMHRVIEVLRVPLLVPSREPRPTTSSARWPRARKRRATRSSWSRPTRISPSLSLKTCASGTR